MNRLLVLSIIIFSLGLLLLIFIKVPIGIALGIISLIVFKMYSLPVMEVAHQFYSGVDSFTWISIPLFVLAGNLMASGGLSRRIVEFSQSLLGHIRGGLGITTIFACSFFAAISGSSPATVAAIGTVMIPEMKKAGYTERFAAAISASGGVLGILIPPSITMIAYGILAGVSIRKLFIGGIIPGIITSIIMMFVTFWYAGREVGFHVEHSFSMRRVFKTFKRGFLSLMAPVVILGGIYAGIFTATESAAVAVLYGLVIGLLYRELNSKEILKTLKDTSITVGTLAVIWAASASYSYVLTISGITEAATGLITSISGNPITIVLLLNVVVIILGCFINAMGMIIMLTPIFVPILNTVGFDLFTFGIIFTVSCEIGFLTPPVGTNLFMAKSLCENTDIMEISKAVLPYIVILCLMIIFFTIFPQTINFLPNLVG